MCGIAGWANLEISNQSPTSGDEAQLHEMCNTIIHRGPDSEGVWLGEDVALGMRRLAIIDVKTGQQPFWNEDRTVIAILNGELYNFQTVREELKAKGHQFHTESDTEILPHLYEEYGEAMVDHINGMFCFAIWDTRRKKLLIARDRFGEKPLYYGVFNKKLIFASEPKALLANVNADPGLSLAAIRQYLSFDYVPAPYSIYEGVSKLPAAHLLTLENGEVKTRRYWQLSFKKRDKKPSFADAKEELSGLLADAVRMRLISDVPLGILLSGGVDSSAVAAYATQFAAGKVKTFSIGFEEDSFDESKFAREVAAHLGTEHYEDHLSVDTAAGLIGDIGKWLDEPLSDGSLLPTFLLSQFVRKHVTVALGGDGGDELFAGYPMYYGHKMARVYKSIPKFLRSGMIEPTVRNLPTSSKNLSFDYKAKRFVAASNYDFVTRHHSWFGSFSLDEQRQLLTGDMKPFADSDVYADAKALLKLCDATDEIEQTQFLDMNFYMAEDILTKVDRASMAVSLEVRAPFLDPRVAEFASSLPLEYKLKGSNGKYILKKTVENMLPKSVTKRAKKGFGIPIASWLKGKLNPLLHDMLSKERLKNQNLFDPDFAAKLIIEHEKGIASHHKQLWTLLVFQLWYENFYSQLRSKSARVIE